MIRSCFSLYPSFSLSLTLSDVFIESNTSFHEVWSPGWTADKAPSLLKASFEKYLSQASEIAVAEVFIIDLG